jgi:hypothetical protein
MLISLDYGGGDNYSYTNHGQFGGANGGGFMPGENQSSPSGDKSVSGLHV